MLERLLMDVRAQHSRVLVLRGEAGVGKTALIDYLADASSGCTVIRVSGVESEMELPFAGLHQLCVPLLDGVDALPPPQRDALRTAFGLASGEPADRFLVGLAVLGLLSASAEQRPIVCLIDDSQWLDQVSAQLLAFVARRLLAERVGMAFAVREPNNQTALDGLPELTVDCLDASGARALLDRASIGPIDTRVRDLIIAETRGNPLAILELSRRLTTTELAGGFVLPNGRPLASQIEQSFVRRVQSLPTDAQRLLLVAAADPLGDGLLVRRAAARLGVGPDAEVAAVHEGLLRFGAQVHFRHPLVRSAAYRAATLADRRAAHQALADVTDPDRDPDRRAWHRASAASSPDESIAADLVGSAARARLRGGVAAAAAFLERATHMSADPARRARRALVAAQAKFEVAALDDSEALATIAEIGPLDDLENANITRLRAQIAFARRRGNDAPPLLLDAARRLEHLDAPASRETYLQALGAAIFAGRLGGQVDERAIAALARRAPASDKRPTGPTELLLDAVAIRYTDGYAAAAEPLRRALNAFRDAAETGDRDVVRWLWLACPVAPEPVAPDLWDFETWRLLSSRAVSIAREAGALGSLPVALSYRAGVHLQAGEFTTAAELISEAHTISTATGSAPLRYTSLALAAWRGDRTAAEAELRAASADATARGEGRALGLIGYSTAVLHNGLGQYEAALAGARFACQHDDPGFYGWSLAEAVEAATRDGAPEIARRALAELEERATAAGTDWSLGVLARSKALLASGPVANDLHRQAIERLERTPAAVDLARAHLVFGESLRRHSERLPARQHLRAALDMFASMGATAFAERARRELAATGEKVNSPRSRQTDQLTPQEAQVARLAARGHTNPEIGNELFVSPRTVEYHLSKVFAKLSISGRRDLAAALVGVGLT